MNTIIYNISEEFLDHFLTTMKNQYKYIYLMKLTVNQFTHRINAGVMVTIVNQSELI